jgi:hypothetical protein
MRATEVRFRKMRPCQIGTQFHTRRQAEVGSLKKDRLEVFATYA